MLFFPVNQCTNIFFIFQVLTVVKPLLDGEIDMLSVPQALFAPLVAAEEPKVRPAAEPASNPSEQAVHVSKKHKDNKVRGPEVKEERVAQ